MSITESESVITLYLNPNSRAIKYWKHISYQRINIFNLIGQNVFKKCQELMLKESIK